MPSGSSIQSPARNQLNAPDLAKVDAARETATGATLDMKTLSGSLAVENVASTINQAANPIELTDPISSFLKSLEKFTSIVDNIAAV